MPTIVTPIFRVSYPNVFAARKNELSGKDEFSVVALFKKGEDLSALKAAAHAAVVAKWGPDKAKWPSNMRSPFREQSERAKDGKLPNGYADGAVYLNLRSSQQPKVVDANVQPILDNTEFYAGCYARASVAAYAYDQKGNRGVSFGLNNLQKMSDGESLGGRTRPEDDFQPVAAAGGSQADPFA